MLTLTSHTGTPAKNAAITKGITSGMLHVYYRKLPGNIPYVKTIEDLIKDIDFLDLEKLNLVMDSGFYSEGNINDLMKHHHKFLIRVRTSLKLVKKHLDKNCDSFVTRTNYDPELHLYMRSYNEQWEYTEEKPRLGETRRAEKDYGYFALMTNGIKNPVQALKIYRLRDLIEKSFRSYTMQSLLNTLYIIEYYQ